MNVIEFSNWHRWKKWFKACVGAHNMQNRWGSDLLTGPKFSYSHTTLKITKTLQTSIKALILLTSSTDKNPPHVGTHTRAFNGPLPGTARVSRCQKGKTNLDFTEAVASAERYASLHLAPNRLPRHHPTAQFFQARYPSCRPTNSVKALKAFALKAAGRSYKTREIITVKLKRHSTSFMLRYHIRRWNKVVYKISWTISWQNSLHVGRWRHSVRPTARHSSRYRSSLEQITDEVPIVRTRRASYSVSAAEWTNPH